MTTYTQWVKSLQWAPYHYYPENSLYDALTHRKLTKIEWNKYTVSINKDPVIKYRDGSGGIWKNITITEKYFKPDEKGVIPVIAEREILPDQIDPLTLSYMITEIRGNPFISDEYYWKGRCQIEYSRICNEKLAEELLKKADILRRFYGADTISIDDRPLTIDCPEAYEGWHNSLKKWCDDTATEKQMEAAKKLPWIYKWFLGKGGNPLIKEFPKKVIDE